MRVLLYKLNLYSCLSPCSSYYFVRLPSVLLYCHRIPHGLFPPPEGRRKEFSSKDSCWESSTSSPNSQGDRLSQLQVHLPGAPQSEQHSLVLTIVKAMSDFLNKQQREIRVKKTVSAFKLEWESTCLFLVFLALIICLFPSENGNRINTWVFQKKISPDFSERKYDLS